MAQNQNQDESSRLNTAKTAETLACSSFRLAEEHFGHKAHLLSGATERLLKIHEREAMLLGCSDTCTYGSDQSFVQPICRVGVRRHRNRVVDWDKVHVPKVMLSENLLAT